MCDRRARRGAAATARPDECSEAAPRDGGCPTFHQNRKPDIDGSRRANAREFPQANQLAASAKQLNESRKLTPALGAYSMMISMHDLG